MEPAQEGDLMAGCSLETAGELVDALARMHAAWWDSPTLDAFQWLPSPNEQAVLDLAKKVSAPAWRSYLAKYGRLLSANARAVAEAAEHDHSVLHRLSARPVTLTHGDLRINNMMFDAQGKLAAIIDWQTAAKARGPMDIASLFVSSLAPADRRKAERDLLPRYHQALLAGGVEGYSYRECWTDYRLSVVNQFSQQAAILHLIGLDISSDPGADPMSAMAARLRAAVEDLELTDLLAAPSLRRRVGSLASRVRSRLA
jgi:aminoglycoside phosphotransferase (APT) family kinase protein